MRLFLFGPEPRDGEAFFEVCSEVVHPADREEDVDSELEGGVRFVSRLVM